MEYKFNEIEANWRKYWAENKTFRAEDFSTKPKYYVLDMFPYPSGAGLHVGHPLGYIASDIYARYKRHQGFNVLHPMGYDSFGLPAEQYAIQTGQHPAITTEQNVARYREQLDKIGFSFDWDREVRTSNPDYYKWTQWIFKQLFDCWYNKDADKAERISTLITRFEKDGNANINAAHDYETVFSAEQWKSFSEKEQNDILMSYRLTYLADSWVNWCPALGTVLANDEVVNGVSERGGHPVEQKLMRQWSMRIKAYAERLLQGLDKIDWSEPIKEQQRNWIGKSEGCSVRFEIENLKFEIGDSKLDDAESPISNLESQINQSQISNFSISNQIEVFTTRPDTIFGVNFLVLAPEHPLVDALTTDEYREAVEAYKKAASLKTERDRQADVKNISGQKIGGKAIHPFTGAEIDIWIGDYVLASYGTGAVMAVPCGDQRDWDFATHFNIPIINIFENVDISEAAYTEKSGKIANSDFLSGLEVKDAIKRAIQEIEAKGIGQGKTNYRLRDAVFSRQRYWGEPFPIYYKNDIPHVIDDAQLPMELPEVDAYLPTADGEPPLARAKKEAWNVFEGDRMEFNTMPGWAGSSWYFLRYMDPQNDGEFVAKEKADYWQNVDLYIGGSEHATGHLLYARFWTKFLFDTGYISFDEPFKKLINQGMILGRSSFVYRRGLYISVGVENTAEHEGKLSSFIENNPVFVSHSKRNEKIDDSENKLLDLLKKTFQEEHPELEILKFSYQRSSIPIHVDINLVDNDKLNIEAFKKSRPEYANAEFIYEDDGVTYLCGSEVEKMSKSKYNVQTPDELVEKYGADTLRMYEMFLGPLEQAKPWDTKGINGVHNFLRKLWRLTHDEQNKIAVSDAEPSAEALKTLHKTIKKITEDLERYSFNTPVSAFMIAVNELTDLKCNNRAIIEPLVILLEPFAPHIAEQIWKELGHTESVSQANWPVFNPDFLVENSFEYPVSFNGKVRFKITLPADMSKEAVEQAVMTHEQTQKYLEGGVPKKMIVVVGRIVNIVV
jgi:leucyl-tRNA synthetase